MSSADLYASLFAFIVALCIWIYDRRRSRSLPLPPGPSKLPIIGNLLDLPKRLEWVTYDQWSRDYGSDVIHLQVAGTSMIIVNSIKAANELFDKRSTKYSSRPHLTMTHDLAGWGWLFSAMTYGEPWKERRRLFQRHFHPSKPEVYRSQTVEFVHKLLYQLLIAPGDFMEHVRHMTGGVIMSLAYGIKIQPSNDPHVALAERAMKGLSESAYPGAFLVESIPLLKYIPEFFPGANFKTKARLWRQDAINFRDVPFSAYLESMKDGTAQISFSSLAMSEIEGSANAASKEEVIKDTAGMFFAAGSDTTVSAIYTFILAMLYYPEVQRKAQEEIDRVLGTSYRLPKFQDEESLPYISAVVKEVIRWKPVVPLAIPHYLESDDVYENMCLPGNSIVIGNSWAMLHCEKDYPDASSFKPERYFKDGKLNPNVRNPATIAFGFGRRVCPGSHIAQSILWFTMVSILATFDISKATDDNGKLIEPSLDYLSTIVSFPSPFKCTLKIRSAAAERLIRTEQISQ